MDLLALLNIDELPEQQTRTSHLAESNPEFELNLGFDACCSCGVSLDATSTGRVPCNACQRVMYCSDACRLQDSKSLPLVIEDATDDEPENALGHSSVVCALLNLCNDDELVDVGDNNLNASQWEAAVSRVRSEYESYPATLANVLLEGECFDEVLRSCHDLNSFTIHILGASEDAELTQGPTILNSNRQMLCSDYAEALAELGDKHKLQAINVYCIGPECPIEPFNESATMKNVEKQIGTLTIRSTRSVYTKDTLVNVEKADLVVMFNPGFTCPDYPDWKETLRNIPKGTPFLLTTNTEMEGMADCQYLLDQDLIQSLPVGLADIFDVRSEGDEASNAFFAVNPFAGSRVRQNGTMANDLFVKNRWMLGGILASFDPSVVVKSSAPSKKIKTGYGFANSKAGNPALI